MLATSLRRSVVGFKTFLIGANTTNVNLLAVAGNPTVKGKYRFVVMPGIVVGHTAASVAQAAIEMGTFPAGSEVELYNYGSIQGRGGLGGISTAGNPGQGGNGGWAVRANYSGFISRIYNYGEMKAGGGGGGSGGCGGAGGNGGRGNIIATSGFEQPRSEVEWYIFDAVPNDNHVSWFGSGANDSSGPGTTTLLGPPGLFEKGDYWGHTQDANPHNSWYVRLHTLAPNGVGAPVNAGGQGGNGAGYNQIQSGGQTGGQSQVGTDPGNGAGKGGPSGNAGKGADGGDWATDGASNANAGNVGLAGNPGPYEGGSNGQSTGLLAGGSGSAGLGIVGAGTANTTLFNHGTVLGTVLSVTVAAV